MKQLSVSVIVCSCICLLGAMGSAYGAPVFNPSTGHWYDVVSSGANGSWTNAENNAVASGGHLVTINNAAEETWLKSTFSLGNMYWMGFTDAAVEGTWVWVSGEPVTYTNWGLGEPSNHTPPSYGEDYGVVNWLATGQWNDWDHMRPDYTHIDGISECAVPAPGALLLSGIGAGFVGWLRRRRAV